MDDLKRKLESLDVPPPSEEAKTRALYMAMQAFEEHQKKSAQGSAQGIRPIHNPLMGWIRSLSMKKAYVFAGSCAAVAVVLAITTTHYSAIMQPVMVPSEPVKSDVPAVAPSQPEIAAEHQAMNEKNKTITLADPKPSIASPASIAPGMAGARDKKEMAFNAERENRSGDAPGKVSSVMASGKPQAERSLAAGMSPYSSDNDRIYYPVPTYTGQDKFDSFVANPIKIVNQEPVSTFSIDVDTASYSFVRRMINGGSLPPKDAVRVEEMVNYFHYNYALPENTSEPFKPNVTVYPTPWNKDTKLLHIGIKGYDIAKAEKRPSNLVFLIDVSGSMSSPDKLPLAKNAMRMLLDSLSPDDTVGIVTYAGYAGTALEPTKVANKQTIIAAIDQLGAGGSTAGAEGIRQAYALAEAHKVKDGVNRVILATDGDFNVGITDQTQLKQFIEQKRESGVFLSVLGFGQGNYNDALMQTLAQHGNGNAAYIDNLSEARKVLVEEASSTLFSIAKDVKIQIEFNPKLISEYRLVGYESRMLKREDFNNDKVDAGEVGSGHAVTAIYEITPAGAKSQGPDELRYQKEAAKPIEDKGNFTGEYGFLKIRYKLPSESVSKLITTPITTAQEQGDIKYTSDDVRFATAVAGFGQLLKSDSNIRNFTFDEVVALADGARGNDPFGYRAEFVNLARLAKSLQANPVPSTPACPPNALCETR